MIARSLLIALALCGLPACAPASLATSGTTLRAIVASQTIPTQPRRETGTDGSAAVAAYANYQQSYVTPQTHADNAAFGSTK
ncbi:hypothetical protein ACFFTM_25300 [Pseudoduganella plicata]|uniref:Pilus assembly protein n=1 Tax=Pseudoduganella plicata TaxID=321984 RepID=A0A4P7BGX1_9BURK|nr:hypothetical protein [Pseudoduganella plicata]QBQ37540.1 hypothetical protein E1742_16230 [Pseudoduganella plicata]GGY91111.1 hypothetical protein GCM10007388_25450 [Pseudoduganella plicata]